MFLTLKGSPVDSLKYIVPVVVLLFVFFAYVKSNGTEHIEEGGYVQKPVMTEVERKLYDTLAAANEGRFLIFAQVQLTGFINPEKGEGAQARLNKIHRKSVDFLLCNNDGKVIAAIELQDASHNRANRKLADSVKANALKSANVPLIEFHARSLPTVNEVKTQIEQIVAVHA